MKEYLIESKSLTKEYRDLKAVDGANIHVEKGAIYGLVGENGSGKSSLLKMLMGLVLPSSGEILLFGSQENLNQSREKLGGIVEAPAFYPYMSARMNLEYYKIQRGLLDDGLVDRTLDLVGLGDTGRKKYKNFSLGMKQRLGIGLALMVEPEILILDEPINGLDPRGIVDLRNLLLKLNREKETSIVISSHILGELSQIASHYGFIDQGRILEEVSAKDLKEKCRAYLAIKVEDLDRASFIIESELNTLDYKVSNEGEIYLFDYVDKSDQVLKILYDEGLRVQSIREKGMELEDYYLDLIGGRKDA